MGYYNIDNYLPIDITFHGSESKNKEVIHPAVPPPTITIFILQKAFFCFSQMFIKKSSVTGNNNSRFG